jgi:hypothetical protein
MATFICHICTQLNDDSISFQHPSFLSLLYHLRERHWKLQNPAVFSLPAPASYQVSPPTENNWSYHLTRQFLPQRSNPSPAQPHKDVMRLLSCAQLYEEMYERHCPMLIETYLPVNDSNVVDVFYTTCDDIFRHSGGINTGRIIALFVLADRLARHPKLNDSHAATVSLAKALADYIDLFLLPWIIEKGAWVNCFCIFRSIRYCEYYLGSTSYIHC